MAHHDAPRPQPGPAATAASRIIPTPKDGITGARLAADALAATAQNASANAMRAALASLAANKPQPQRKPGLFARVRSAFKQVFWTDEPLIETNAIEAMSQRKKAGITTPHAGPVTAVRLVGGLHDGEYRFLCRSIDTITLEDTDGFRYSYVRSGANTFIFKDLGGAP